MSLTHTVHPKLTQAIVIAMLLGIGFGALLHALPHVAWVNTYIVSGAVDVIAQLFIALMKMAVVPVVFVTLVSGAATLGDLKRLGRIGLKTVSYYLFTTAVAITLALTVAQFLHLGQGLSFNVPATNFSVAPPPLKQTLINLVPTNPIDAMAKGHMLQVIVFAILVGMCLPHAGAAGQRMQSWFQDASQVVMRLILMIIHCAPIGVFCLITQVLAREGLYVMTELLGYFFTVLLVLAIHVTVTNSIILTIMGKLNPKIFFRKFYPAMLFGFSTSSSNATLPYTLSIVENKLGVNNSVASFVIPMGATINMDGTAIMQGVATVFIAHFYGLHLTLSHFVTIILMSTLASIGTAGVPGVGLVTLTMVLQQIGIGVDAIGLIWGVDRLLDMARTAVNITGDATIACVVAKAENEFDNKLFADQSV